MFAICIESSHAKGMGHFFRMLNFFEAIKNTDKTCILYINDHLPARKILYSKKIPYRIVNLKDYKSNWESSLIKIDSISLWINDRLDTDIRHAKNVKKSFIPLITFDDHGSGALLADLHIAAMTFFDDQSLGGEKVLCGLDYLILNPKVLDYSRIRCELNSVLVTLGGSDTYGVTVKVVNILRKLKIKIKITVILGPSFQHKNELDKVFDKDFVLKQNVSSMIGEFYHHDIAITGGGLTPFEANASGLPCIVIANEIFEIPNGKELQRLGGSIFAGHHEALTAPLFNENLPLNQMSLDGMENISLNGSARIINLIREMI